jgi:hypothetical protein
MLIPMFLKVKTATVFAYVIVFTINGDADSRKVGAEFKFI